MPIESVLADAGEFQFPAGDLVIYLFNPFGAETMGRVLGNLARCLAETPRHVVVVLLWPEHGAMVAALPGMRRVRGTRRHEVYEAGREFAGRQIGRTTRRAGCGIEGWYAERTGVQSGK